MPKDEFLSFLVRTLDAYGESFRQQAKFYADLPRDPDPGVQARRDEVVNAFVARHGDSIHIAGWICHYMALNNIPLVSEGNTLREYLYEDIFRRISLGGCDP